MQVVRGDAAALVAAQRGVGGGVVLGKARRQQQQQGGLSVLRPADGEVVVPDAMRAVVGEQKEGSV